MRRAFDAASKWRYNRASAQSASMFSPLSVAHSQARAALQSRITVLTCILRTSAIFHRQASEVTHLDHFGFTRIEARKLVQRLVQRDELIRTGLACD